MRTYLNLSRRPFTNHRLFWIAVALVFFVTLYFGLWVTAEKTRVSARAEELNMRIKAQSAEVEALRQEQENKKREQQQVVMTEDQARQLLSARRLIVRKSFSWNRLISQIESFVPQDTRITSIKVDEVYGTQGQAMAAVEVKALGKTANQMTEMMANLEKSGGLFVINQTSQEAAVETGEVPFTLNLTYSSSRGGA